MPLIAINADLTRACELLERIATAAQRAWPEPKPEEKPTIRRTEPQDIGRVKVDEGVAEAKIREMERRYGGQ